jgi:hypothetical protein
MVLERVPEDQRWSTENWDRLRGFPWDIQPRQQKSERKMTSGRDAEATKLERPRPPVLEPQARKMYVTKADVVKFGGTDGCHGCACIALGSSAVQPHSDECRTRIAKKLMESESGARRLEEHRRRRRGVERKENTEDRAEPEGEQERREDKGKVSPGRATEGVQSKEIEIRGKACSRVAPRAAEGKDQEELAK